MMQMGSKGRTGSNSGLANRCKNLKEYKGLICGINKQDNPYSLYIQLQIRLYKAQTLWYINLWSSQVFHHRTISVSSTIFPGVSMADRWTDDKPAFPLVQYWMKMNHLFIHNFLFNSSWKPYVTRKNFRTRTTHVYLQQWSGGSSCTGLNIC